MSMCVLRFCDYVFPNNPKNINVSREISEKEDLSVITGDGELYGENCLEELERIKALFQNKTKGSLYVPGIGAFFAQMTRFDFEISTLPKLINYSFTFTQVNKSECEYACEYKVKGNESIWSIAYMLGCDVDTLVKLNEGKIKSCFFEDGDRLIVPVCSMGVG